MKTFCCDSCQALVFFENVHCLQCMHVLGFLPEALDLSALEPAGDGRWVALSSSVHGRFYRSCANGEQHDACNWLVSDADPETLCQSCRLNVVIPTLNDTNKLLWFKIEQAKRRLMYTLLRLRLPTWALPDEDRPALRFSILADIPGEPPVMTGHSNGLITLNLAEADDAEREHRRLVLGEPYRTLLGHMRHEVAHYFWDRLISRTPRIDDFRSLFGDESKDYAAALWMHHQGGPPGDWQNSFVSAYASSHPWEDWAETWAHYLHIVDTLETAASFGLRLRPKHPSAHTMAAVARDSFDAGAGFDQLLEQWLPLTYALNSLNRGMGLPDLYPFVLSNPVIRKLGFIHAIVREFATADTFAADAS